MIKTVMLYETGDGVRHDTIDKAVLADRTMAVDRFLVSERDRLGLKLEDVGRMAGVIASAFAGLLPILQKDYKEGTTAFIGNRPGVPAATVISDSRPGALFVVGLDGRLEPTTVEGVARQYVERSREEKIAERIAAERGPLERAIKEASRA